MNNFITKDYLTCSASLVNLNKPQIIVYLNYLDEMFKIVRWYFFFQYFVKYEISEKIWTFFSEIN